MTTLYTARLAGVDGLAPTLRTALEARFLWEIEQLFGDDLVAAQALHHDTDGGTEPLPLLWRDAEQRVLQLMAQTGELPDGARFHCDVTTAFFRPRPAGTVIGPLYFITATSTSLGPQRREQLLAAVRGELNRQFGDEAAAAGALHAEHDSDENGDEPLLWCEAVAIAERITLSRAGVMRDAVRFEYALNFDAMFPSSTPSLWPQEPPAQG